MKNSLLLSLLLSVGALAQPVVVTTDTQVRMPENYTVQVSASYPCFSYRSGVRTSTVPCLVGIHIAMAPDTLSNTVRDFLVTVTYSNATATMVWQGQTRLPAQQSLAELEFVPDPRVTPVTVSSIWITEQDEAGLMCPPSSAPSCPAPPKPPIPPVVVPPVTPPPVPPVVPPTKPPCRKEHDSEDRGCKDKDVQ